MTWRAIERLRPNVADAVFDDGISYGLSIESDSDGRSKASSGNESLRWRLGVRSYINESNLSRARLRRGGIWCGHKLRHQLAVGRKVHCAGHKPVRERT